MYCADCWLGSPSLVWSSPHLGPAAASTRPALDTPPDTPAHTSASSSPQSSTGTRTHSNQEDPPSVSTLSPSPPPGLHVTMQRLYKCDLHAPASAQFIDLVLEAVTRPLCEAAQMVYTYTLSSGRKQVYYLRNKISLIVFLLVDMIFFA